MKTKTIISTILILFITIMFTGGGHGTYLPAKIFYPYTMIISELQDFIGITALLLAIIEIPIYVYIWNKKPKWKYYLIGVHILAIIIAFSLTSNSF